MAEVSIVQRFDAPPARVWDAMTDHVGFGRRMRADIRLEREGVPPPNGLGAVRVVRARGTTVREEVVRWDESSAMGYRVIGGAPLRNHYGEFTLEPDGRGTRLRYRIRFEWPWWAGGVMVGHLVARLLEREISAGLRRMAADLARVAT